MIEHVQGRRNVSALKSCEQCAGFDDFGAGGVDEQGSRTQRVEVLRRDDATGVVKQRHMHADHV